MSSRVSVQEPRRGRKGSSEQMNWSGADRKSKEGASPKKTRASKEDVSFKNKSDKAKAGLAQRRMTRKSRDEAQWAVAEKWAPPRRLTDTELAAARKLFYELDSDGSGAIDKEELGSMMRSLGQSPTDQELEELIKSVDQQGDNDGKIQLREFYTLYTRGLDTKGAVAMGDVNNTFAAVGGDIAAENSTVSHEQVQQFMKAEYDLEVDFSETFGISAEQLSKSNFKQVLGVSE